MEERAHAELVRKVKGRELDARRQYTVFPPVQTGAQARGVVDTRWVLSWKEVRGKKAAEARMVARGYQDPDLEGGDVVIAGYEKPVVTSAADPPDRLENEGDLEIGN